MIFVIIIDNLNSFFLPNSIFSQKILTKISQYYFKIALNTQINSFNKNQKIIFFVILNISLFSIQNNNDKTKFLSALK